MSDRPEPRRLVVVASAAERGMHYLGIGAISDYLLLNTSGFHFSRVDSSHAAVSEPIERGFCRLCAEVQPAAVVVVDTFGHGRVGLARRLDDLLEIAEQLDVSVTSCVVVDGSCESVRFAESTIDHLRYRADQLVLEFLKVGESSAWKESAFGKFAVSALNVHELSIPNLGPDQLHAVQMEQERFGRSPSLYDLAERSLDPFAAERSKHSWRAVEQKLQRVRPMFLPAGRNALS